MRGVTSENIDCTAHELAVAKRLKVAFCCAAVGMSKAIHPGCILRIIAHRTELADSDFLSVVTVLTADTSPTAGPVPGHGLGLDAAI